MIQLGQFTFYRSYYEAIQGLDNPKLRCQIYETMFNYVLNGVEPDPQTNIGIVNTIFLINKPHLDASRRKAMNALAKGKQASPPPPAESAPVPPENNTSPAPEPAEEPQEDRAEERSRNQMLQRLRNYQ